MRLKTRPRQPAAAASPEARAVARTRVLLRKAIRETGSGTLVKAADVLALLDAASDTAEPVQAHPAMHPRADPITGCLPVTAEDPQP